ncbi:MAG: hypothetical protein GY832_05420 [Chloroflexi bacterium]|nr:hypothetical protein [Chloroflexota bacterium]
MVQYLHGDHPSTNPGQVLGSTSLATDKSGAEVTGHPLLSLRQRAVERQRWLQDRALVEREQRVGADRDGGSEWEQLY